MRFNVNALRRPAAAAAVALAALAGVSCGGGTPVTEFKPSRIIAFGDETSVIVDIDANSNGHKYSVNGVSTTGGSDIDCRINPLWVQAVASSYGTFIFPQCNPAPSTVIDPPNRIRATFGARATDISSQIDAQFAESNIRAGDLVTVLVGVNDVLAQYALYPTQSEVDLTAAIDAAGTEVANQVNRLSGFGAKVIVSTIPDVSYSPYAIAERNAHIDTDRQLLIQRLVDRFNAALRLEIENDGHKIALVQLDESTRLIGKFPGINGITNSTQGACDLSQSLLTPPSILDCTDSTLVEGAVGGSHLWADDRRLSSGGQRVLGDLAVTRAKNNPF